VIYLDHHAATPLAPGVPEAIAAAHESGWANPASVHAAGRAARRWIEEARDRITTAVGAVPADVVLTSGGTEACNLGVLGLAVGASSRRIVTTDVEHPAVMAAVDVLAERGIEVVRMPVLDGAPPAPSELASWCDGETLVAIQWINHETGTIFPVAEYGAVCRARGAQLFVDATQALGKVAVDVSDVGAHAIALASAKVGGPAGAGALVVARGVDLDPILRGGSQERGRRPGTPDVAAHAGFGAACAQIEARLSAMPRLARIQHRIESMLTAAGAVLNAAAGPRSATVVNVSIEGWRGDALVAALDLEGVAVSSGAACSSGLDEPSAVIAAMHPEAPWRARSALRLSFGPETPDTLPILLPPILTRVLARGTRSGTDRTTT
jgi:cysteine desulfurase